MREVEGRPGKHELSDDERDELVQARVQEMTAKTEADRARRFAGGVMVAKTGWGELDANAETLPWFLKKGWTALPG